MVKRLLAILAATLLAISSHPVLKAQMGDLDPALMHSVLTNLFGTHEEFSAVAETWSLALVSSWQAIKQCRFQRGIGF